MNPKIRALIWEQLRTAGTLTVWALVLTIIVIVSTIISTWLMVSEDFITVSTFCITGLPVLLLFRLNVAGHVDVQYEPRMSRLPVDTTLLTFIQIVARMVCIAVFFAGLNLLDWIILREELPLYILFNTCALYVILQALVWSRTYLTLLILPIAALIYGSVHFVIAISEDHFIKATRDIEYSQLISKYISVIGRIVDNAIKELEYSDFTMPLIVLLTPALLLAWQGVCWERRNEQRRFMSFSGVLVLAEKLRMPLSHGFDYVSDARIWFERAQSGILVGIIFFMGMLLFPWTGGINLLGVNTSHYFGLACAAILIGTIRDFSRHLWPISITEFNRTKPISNAWLAWSHLITMTRYAFFALVILFVLSNIAYIILLPERGILITMMREGIGGFTPLFVILEPLFWGCVFVWIGLWCAEPIVLGFVVLLAIDLPNQFLIQYSPILSGDDQQLFLCGFCLYLIIRSINLLYYAWKNNVLTKRQWGIYAVLHLLLPLFVWWPGPSELPAAIESFYLILAVTSLVLSPIVALPRQVAKKRTLA